MALSIHFSIHITTRKAMSMRNLITLTLALFVLAGTLTGQTKQKSAPKEAATKSETVVINVPTVVCGTCKANITKAVNKVAGVKSVKVDLKKKTATIAFASGKTTLDKLEMAISKAGYDANKTKRDPAAYEKLDECCKKD
jgi:mercuric ion binding protein